MGRWETNGIFGIKKQALANGKPKNLEIKCLDEKLNHANDIYWKPFNIWSLWTRMLNNCNCNELALPVLVLRDRSYQIKHHQKEIKRDAKHSQLNSAEWTGT
jgi:hypothetical protein